MQMKKPTVSGSFFSWLWVGLCSVSIFLTVPVARTIQRYVYAKWGRVTFLYLVLAAIAIGFGALFYFLVLKFRIRTPSNYIWLLIITGLYLYFTLKLKNIPEEAVHFLEYGLLGFFLFKAISHNVKDKSIYVTATLFALLIGTFDEILQWITPERYWDFRDVGLNALSGGLFQLAIWKIVRPKIISEKMNSQSFKLLASVFASCLIILGLCFSNTPRRVTWYTERIPFLSSLQREETMSRPGYKYNDPDIGVFFSRLTPEEMQEKDAQHREEYTQVLNESVNRDYEQFLREYNPISYPFLHELRVHVFRRDKYFEKASKASRLKEKKKFYFIAYKENLILRKYFTLSITDSVFWWNENKIMESERLIDKSQSYKSPVSSYLFTPSKEKTIWSAIATIVVILILINFVWKFKEKNAKRSKI